MSETPKLRCAVIEFADDVEAQRKKDWPIYRCPECNCWDYAIQGPNVDPGEYICDECGTHYLVEKFVSMSDDLSSICGSAIVTTLNFVGPAQQVVLSFSRDGQVTFGPGFNGDEASKTFWRQVAQNNPDYLVLERARKAERERCVQILLDLKGSRHATDRNDVLEEAIAEIKELK